MSDTKLFVREMLPEDFSTVAELSSQLGYPVSESDIASRYEAISMSDEARLTVACTEGIVIGWCHVYRVRLLETEGYAELGGLIVDQNWRRRGGGKALINDAEEWVISRGIGRLRAYSGAHREDAHQFYLSVGYVQRMRAVFERIVEETDK